MSAMDSPPDPRALVEEFAGGYRFDLDDGRAAFQRLIRFFERCLCSSSG